MEVKSKKCFVCNLEFPVDKLEINKEVIMPVCNICKGTDKEKKIVRELLDSLADGLVCGCI